MNNFSWKYLLLAVPAVAAALGVQYVVRKNRPKPSDGEVAVMLKPSHFKKDVVGEGKRMPAAKGEGFRDVGAVARQDDRPAERMVEREVSADPQATREQERVSHKAAQEAEMANARDEDVDTYAAADLEAELAKPMGPSPEEDVASYDTHVVRMNRSKAEVAIDKKTAEAAKAGVEPVEQERKPAAPAQMDEKTRAALDAVPFAGRKCSNLEFRGDGPDGTKVTKEEWARVMTVFHGAKGELLGWLRRYKKELPDKTAYIMEAQVRNLKIQRPPALEEPDLTWRGIGVWGKDQRGEPILRLGSGFVKLVMRNPQRGKFEMTRLVAQSWAPCELQRMDAGAPWELLLTCMGVSEAQSCGTGTYSESGWAVSSVLASLVSNPGCTLPAFTQGSVAACAKRVPLPLTLAASPADHAETTQVAARANAEVKP